MPNNDWVVQRRAGAAESRANNVIYIGRASFRMEPAPLLPNKLGATPAPQVELMDTHYDTGPVGGGDPGLDVPFSPAASDDGEGAPYLRLRTGAEGGDAATPTPLVDLTHLAVAMPDVPPATPPLVELQSLPPLDPADETGVTPIQTVLRPSRLALSRPRLAGLGVLAFSAGLLTAATAGVVARPARTVAAAQRTPAALATAATAIPASANPPVLAATEVTAHPAPSTPPAFAGVPPSQGGGDRPTADAEGQVARAAAGAGANTDSAPIAAAPAAKTAAAPIGKARGKAATPTRARGRAPARSRSGNRADPGAGPQVLASPATEAEPTEPVVKEAPPAAPAPAKRGANWIDPFAE